MKHTITPEDANHSFEDMLSALQNHFANINLSEPESIKLANEYYK